MTRTFASLFAALLVFGLWAPTLSAPAAAHPAPASTPVSLGTVA